jgi:hypothetical protein
MTPDQNLLRKRIPRYDGNQMNLMKTPSKISKPSGPEEFLV